MQCRFRRFPQAASLGLKTPAFRPERMRCLTRRFGIVAVRREAGHGQSAERLRGVIVVLWRAGLRINEAITLNETDLSASAGSITVRFGKGGRRRQVGMDAWAWEHLRPW